MQVYLVRLIDTKEIVGIFAAHNLANLRWLADQCTETQGCEYAVLGEGGIMWPKRGASPAVYAGTIDDSEEDDQRIADFAANYFKEAEFDELWWERLDSGIKLKFRALDRSAPVAPVAIEDLFDPPENLH